MTIPHQHWSDILQIVNNQSPRCAALLTVAVPSGLKRVTGGCHIQVMTRRVTQRAKLSELRENVPD